MFTFKPIAREIVTVFQYFVDVMALRELHHQLRRLAQLIISIAKVAHRIPLSATELSQRHADPIAKYLISDRPQNAFDAVSIEHGFHTNTARFAIILVVHQLLMMLLDLSTTVDYGFCQLLI